MGRARLAAGTLSLLVIAGLLSGCSSPERTPGASASPSEIESQRRILEIANRPPANTPTSVLDPCALVVGPRRDSQILYGHQPLHTCEILLGDPRKQGDTTNIRIVIHPGEGLARATYTVGSHDVGPDSPPSTVTAQDFQSANSVLAKYSYVQRSARIRIDAVSSVSIIILGPYRESTKPSSDQQIHDALIERVEKHLPLPP